MTPSPRRKEPSLEGQAAVGLYAASAVDEAVPVVFLVTHYLCFTDYFAYAGMSAIDIPKEVLSNVKQVSDLVKLSGMRGDANDPKTTLGSFLKYIGRPWTRRRLASQRSLPRTLRRWSMIGSSLGMHLTRRAHLTWKSVGKRW